MAKNKNYKKSNRNYKSKRKENSHTNAPIKEDDLVKSSVNDPTWYNSNNQLSFDAGTFSFNTGIGDKISVAQRAYSVPGVAAIGILPIPIVSNTATDPVNITSRAFFSNVLRANSRSNPDYEASDLMMYMIAIANAWSALYWARRIYGLCNVYSQYNRYMPKQVLLADGVDYESILNDMANFRYEVNAFATQLATYCVPKDIPYFKRMAWLFSNVYMDDPTSRSSLYIYHPETFGMWSDVNDHGSSIVFAPYGPKHADGSDMFGIVSSPATLTTKAEIITMLRTLITALRDSTDVNNMSGDILKAFGPENILVPDTIPADYTVFPEYVPEVLTQIHNATLNGCVMDTDLGAMLTQDQDSLNIYSDVIFNPFGNGKSLSTAKSMTNAFGMEFAGNVLLDMDKESPSSDDVLVATRLLTYPTYKSYTVGGVSGYNGVSVKYGGMDVATTMYYVRFNSVSVNGVVQWAPDVSEPLSALKYAYASSGNTYINTNNGSYKGDVGATQNTGFITVHPTIQQAISDIEFVSMLEQHPYFKVYANDEEGGTTAGDRIPIGDLNNYITIDEFALSRIHQAAMFSLFNIPGIAIK